MNAEDFDILFRSRKTLLNILNDKGYDITPYEKFGPWEIESMISNEKKNALKMKLMKKEGSTNKFTNCVVIYRLNRLKLSITRFMEGLLNPDIESEDFIDNPESTEVIVILLEPVNTVSNIDKKDVFHVAALNALNNKLHISFFQADSLVNNPQDHILVPKHVIIPKEEYPSLKKKLNIQSISNLPFIRFHQDIQARILGAIPGDIIQVTRPSPSAGVETVYRVCVP